jgi:hypothetical protein
VLQQHLHAHADAEQRLGGGGLQHRFEQARLAQLAHAVGMAPWPGSTTRCAARTWAGSAVMTALTCVSCVACITACATERRLPMP